MQERLKSEDPESEVDVGARKGMEGGGEAAYAESSVRMRFVGVREEEELELRFDIVVGLCGGV